MSLITRWFDLDPGDEGFDGYTMDEINNVLYVNKCDFEKIFLDWIDTKLFANKNMTMVLYYIINKKIFCEDNIKNPHFLLHDIQIYLNIDWYDVSNIDNITINLSDHDDNFSCTFQLFINDDKEPISLSLIGFRSVNTKTDNTEFVPISMKYTISSNGNTKRDFKEFTYIDDMNPDRIPTHKISNIYFDNTFISSEDKIVINNKDLTTNDLINMELDRAEVINPKYTEDEMKEDINKTKEKKMRVKVRKIRKRNID